MAADLPTPTSLSSADTGGAAGLEAPADGVDEPQGEAFPVVGIGASAGGLKAIQSFFAALPARPGMAFVVVQHLSPDHESALAQLVQTRTDMTVRQVGDHPTLEADRVYVIPPGKHLESDAGRLTLVDPADRHGRPLAVDRFLRALAEDVGGRAVCVILSGTGTDGALGLRAVKERGGLTMAQDPTDADYDGMPRSAIATGLVDVVGTPDELADTLVRFRNAGGLSAGWEAPAASAPRDDDEALSTLFDHLRARTGYSFDGYKRSTIGRRLRRRMLVHGIPSLDRYAAFVMSDPDETRALLRDFLISVTQFFRDPAAFDVLEREGIPAAFEGKGRGDHVRVWVAGCATGEEAYSVAMLLSEYRDTLADPPDVQVFATDIDETALDRARGGVYPATSTGDLTARRRRRFFDDVEGGIRVKPGLREMLLFARHDLLSDPPFSTLDLITCRNVLIYFNRSVQARVFSSFHYGLRPGGGLFLGGAEGPGLLLKGFAEVDKTARLYRRRDESLGAGPLAASANGKARPPAPARPEEGADAGTLLDRYGRWTLEAYAPPRLLVNEAGDIQHVFGRAGDYLRDREGPVTQNVASKVSPAFRVNLRTAVHRAVSRGEATDTRFHHVIVDGEPRVVRLHVGLAAGAMAGEGLAEVVFIELDPASVERLSADGAAPGGEARGDEAAARFERDLEEVQERLRATIEEQETAKEELKASNEELQSMNEELQSTTEELETSKEELQSMNEELQTLNQELKTKVEELTRTNADLQNLVAATEIATVFLDRRLRVTRYTPAAAGLFNLIPGDVGRPLEHVTHQLALDDLAGLARRVLSALEPYEETVSGRDGGGYTVRLLPYRAADEQVEGVVLTVTDVTDLRDAREEALRRVRQQEAIAALGRFVLTTSDVGGAFDRAVQLIAEAIRVPLVKVLEHDAGAGVLRVVSGVGWGEGAVGTATAPDGRDSQGGYTLVAREPVVVPDLAVETRFVGPALLLDRGVQSGVSVPIEGPGGTPWGVLGAHAREPRAFTDIDGQFMESMAAVLSAALRRRRDEAIIQAQVAEIESVYGLAPVGLAFMDETLRYRRINRRLADINGAPVEDHIGRRTREILPDLARQIEPILQGVLESGTAVEAIEIRGTTPSAPGDERVWLCSYVPTATEEGVVGVSIVVNDITDRKRTEDAIRSSEERLRLAMQAGRLGTFRRDLADGTLEFDVRCQEIYGVPHGESVEVAMEWIHPDDREAVEQAIARSLDPADPVDDYDIQHRILIAGEPTRWISVQARVQFDGDGPDRRPVEMIGVALDVSGTKAAERDLEDARARLALALAVGDAGTYDLDLLAGTVTYDEGAQQVLGVPDGLPIEEAMGTVHPDDRGAVEARIEAAMDPTAPDDTFRSVHRQVRPDGQMLWVSSRGVAQFDGEARRPTRLVGTLADITDLKEAQDLVRRQLLEIDAYFNAVPVAIAVFDREGRYVRINASMASILGASSEALIGMHPGAEFPPEFADATEPLLRRALSVGEPLRDVEMRLPLPRDPEGPLHDWLLSYVPLVEGGDVTGTLLVVQDVTALKRAQAGLQTLTSELEARVVLRTAEVRRLVGDLTEAERRERGRVAQILHDDLQQLLYAVQFKFEAMRRQDAAAHRSLLVEADDLIARAIHVTRTLTVDLSPPVLRGEGLDRTFEWLAHSLDEAYGLQVSVEREGEVQVGKTVQVLLFQIVRELLFNVVKHAGTSTATVHVGLLPSGNLQVVVADDGVGIPAGVPSDEDETGFGLLSVRERIRLVGGTVIVESSAGDGTRITIECPSNL